MSKEHNMHIYLTTIITSRLILIFFSNIHIAYYKKRSREREFTLFGQPKINGGKLQHNPIVVRGGAWFRLIFTCNRKYAATAAGWGREACIRSCAYWSSFLHIFICGNCQVLTTSLQLIPVLRIRVIYLSDTDLVFKIWSDPDAVFKTCSDPDTVLT